MAGPIIKSMQSLKAPPVEEEEPNPHPPGSLAY